jgi:hypothetical protein
MKSSSAAASEAASFGQALQLRGASHLGNAGPFHCLTDWNAPRCAAAWTSFAEAVLATARPELPSADESYPQPRCLILRTGLSDFAALEAEDMLPSILDDAHEPLANRFSDLDTAITEAEGKVRRPGYDLSSCFGQVGARAQVTNAPTRQLLWLFAVARGAAGLNSN